MKSYRNYIFDLYGTLIDIHTNENYRFLWDNFSMLLKRYYGINYPSGKLQKTYLHLCSQETRRLEEEKGFKPVEIDIGNVFAALAQAKGSRLSQSDIADIAVEFRLLSTVRIQLFPQATAVLQMLKEQGKKIYLLSNAQQLFTDREIDELGLRSYFDAIFYSSSHGCKKPDHRFFDCLFTGEKLLKEESVMIGNDYYDDILPAHHYGLDSFYISSPQSRRFTGSLPDNCTRIKMLSEIMKKQQVSPAAGKDYI